MLHQGAANRLLDPEGGVGAEADPRVAVEALHGTHQAQVPFSDQVFQRQTSAEVTPRKMDHKAEVGSDQLVTGVWVASRDPLSQFSLFLS
jgi:hypothetical protein